MVRYDRSLERIVFQVPPICNFLTKTSKLRVLTNAERDEQGSKVTDFFSRTDDLFNEMIWQKKLRGTRYDMRRGREREREREYRDDYLCFYFADNPLLYAISRNMPLWNNIAFLLAVICNLLVAIFYPFPKVEGKSSFSAHSFEKIVRNSNFLRARIEWLIIIFCKIQTETSISKPIQ